VLDSTRCGYHFIENSLNVPKKNKRAKKQIVKQNDQHMHDMMETAREYNQRSKMPKKKGGNSAGHYK